MSAPTPSPSGEGTSYPNALHNLSLACIVLCPTLLALPPRRADLLSGALVLTTALAANQLHRERYGRGILSRFAGSTPQTLPTERAREMQAALQAQRPEKEGKSVGEKVWYGQEKKEGWEERRDREIQAKFKEGKGIGDVIAEQVWEVWNQEKGGEDGGEKKT